MGLYNFKERFVPRIRLWAQDPEHPDAKSHTIRAPRKGGREDKPGDTMYLYTGLRQKGAARIIEPVTCAKVESVVFVRYVIPPGVYTDVWIGPFLPDVLDDEAKQAEVIRDPKAHGLVVLDEAELEQFARRDGFENFEEMMSFWNGRLPFYGHIFHWRPAASFVVNTSGCEKPMAKRTAAAIESLAETAYRTLTVGPQR